MSSRQRVSSLPAWAPLWCGAVHDAADARVGEPLCGQCYDYGAQVLFTWWAPELWRRFTIALRRQVAAAIRDAGGDANLVRVSFVKVVEFQRRAVPHFHAVIRLDGPPADDGQPTPPPAVGIDAGRLAALVHQVAAQVSVAVPAPNATTVTVRFGAQTDAQPITSTSVSGGTVSAAPGSDDRGGGGASGAGRSPRRAAGYLAKYVCKSVAEFGLAAQRMSPLAIDTLDVREHIRVILSTLRDLAGLPGYEPMLRWLHTLGYRGHVTSKSRRFSTTMAALRARRAAWHQQHTGTAELARPCSDDPEGNRVIVWRLRHVGYGSDGDRMLAVSAAVRARRAHVNPSPSTSALARIADTGELLGNLP
ncbi:hypothetical protein MSM1_17930 [Mycobacterium sp. SM1]|nr:replication initiator [Mycobacterium sp. SM1]MBS4730128.1 hypothetical protein [Mycobacterium sp. SM1]